MLEERDKSVNKMWTRLELIYLQSLSQSVLIIVCHQALWCHDIMVMTFLYSHNRTQDDVKLKSGPSYKPALNKVKFESDIKKTNSKSEIPNTDPKYKKELICMSPDDELKSYRVLKICRILHYKLLQHQSILRKKDFFLFSALIQSICREAVISPKPKSTTRSSPVKV